MIARKTQMKCSTEIQFSSLEEERLRRKEGIERNIVIRD